MKKKILVCVILTDTPSQKLTDSLRAMKGNEKYNVVIHCYDYRILKNEEIQLDFAKVKSISFEKKLDVHSEIASSLFSTGATAFLCITQSVDLPSSFIDDIGIHRLEDENVGSIYSDFYVRHGDLVTSFVHKSMPIVTNLLPVIVMSRDVFLKNIEHGRDAVSASLHSSVSIHVPKKLYTTSIDG